MHSYFFYRILGVFSVVLQSISNSTIGLEPVVALELLPTAVLGSLGLASSSFNNMFGLLSRMDRFPGLAVGGANVQS
jgi:hypothetical protein